jgi:hypothetical protein
VRSRPHKRHWIGYSALLIVCAGCVVIAVESLLHPTWSTYLGSGMTAPRGVHSNGPKGAGAVVFIVFPIVVAGIVAVRLWWDLRIALEARRQRHRHHEFEP